MKQILLSVVFVVCGFMAFSQSDTAKVENPKTGWTFGGVPVVAYDTDIGFQYGVLGNLYYYGDGSTYPNYMHNIFFQASNTTKGSMLMRLFYDSEQLLSKKNLRFTSDLSYIADQGIGFYGFNGSESFYNNAFEVTDDPMYRTRMFYRHKRVLFRFQTDIQGKFSNPKWRWTAGAAMTHFDISTVDVASLNKGKDSVDLLPVNPTLYDEYVKYGLIKADEANGGYVNFVKGGIVYDTREKESNPSTGLWDEAVLWAAPSFLGGSNSFAGISLIHRHYLPIVKDKVTFAYRLGYKGVIAGDMPYYFTSYMVSSFNLAAYREGLGGASNIRGMLKNRLVGNGFTYGNFCLRYKFVEFVVAKQNVYLALNGFLDAGKVVQPYDVDRTNVPMHLQNEFFKSGYDRMHYTVGGGLHIALNENFVILANYGQVLEEQDGSSAFYITTNWLF